MVDKNPNQADMSKQTKPESTPDQQPAATIPKVEAAAAQPNPADDELGRDIEQLRAELDAAKDRALRFQAELDNYRKRVSRQMDEERRYAQVPLIGDLLPVLDNISRALEAAEKTADAVSLLEGFKMMGRQLQAVLQRHHCTRIESLGQPFDPHLHHAILQQPSAEVPPNTVLHETQAGYRVHDRVVRPAHVIVSAAPPQTKSPEAEEESDSPQRDSDSATPGRAGGDGQPD